MISASGREMVGHLMRLVTGDDNVATGPMTSAMAGGDDRRKKLEAWCAARTVEEITETLVQAGIPVGPVRSIPEVARDAHTREREMFVKQPDALAGEMHVPGLAVKMSATPGRVGPVPTPGQHTDEILSTLLGLDASRLADLRKANVIA